MAPFLQFPVSLQIPPPKRIPSFYMLILQIPPPPYLEFIISFHSPLLFVLIRQIHFPTRAQLNNLMSITPNPPCSLDFHTFSHDGHEFSYYMNLSPIRTFIESILDFPSPSHACNIKTSKITVWT